MKKIEKLELDDIFNELGGTRVLLDKINELVDAVNVLGMLVVGIDLGVSDDSETA